MQNATSLNQSPGVFVFKVYYVQNLTYGTVPSRHMSGTAAGGPMFPVPRAGPGSTPPPRSIPLAAPLWLLPESL